MMKRRWFGNKSSMAGSLAKWMPCAMPGRSARRDHRAPLADEVRRACDHCRQPQPCGLYQELFCNR